jgi:hypothetical protein
MRYIFPLVIGLIFISPPLSHAQVLDICLNDSRDLKSYRTCIFSAFSGIPNLFSMISSFMTDSRT